MTSRGISRSTLLALWGVFLALPVAATMLYSVATVWRGRALPDGFTVSVSRSMVMRRSMFPMLSIRPSTE